MLDIRELKLPPNTELVIIIDQEMPEITIHLGTPRWRVFNRRVHTQRMLSRAALLQVGLQNLVDEMAKDIPPAEDQGTA